MKRRILPNVGRGDPQSGARYREPELMRDRYASPNLRRVAERRAYVSPIAWMVVVSAHAWRERSRAREPRRFWTGMQENTAAENARRRMRTINLLVFAVSLKA